jgi:histone H3/H4
MSAALSSVVLKRIAKTIEQLNQGVDQAALDLINLIVMRLSQSLFPKFASCDLEGVAPKGIKVRLSEMNNAMINQVKGDAERFNASLAVPAATTKRIIRCSVGDKAEIKEDALLFMSKFYATLAYHIMVNAALVANDKNRARLLPADIAASIEMPVDENMNGHLQQLLKEAKKLCNGRSSDTKKARRSASREKKSREKCADYPDKVWRKGYKSATGANVKGTCVKNFYKK